MLKIVGNTWLRRSLTCGLGAQPPLRDTPKLSFHRRGILPIAFTTASHKPSRAMGLRAWPKNRAGAGVLRNAGYDEVKSNAAGSAVTLHEEIDVGFPRCTTNHNEPAARINSASQQHNHTKGA
jgi:hypothetical protein